MKQTARWEGPNVNVEYGVYVGIGRKLMRQDVRMSGYGDKSLEGRT
jgi:hypothetical protein